MTQIIVEALEITGQRGIINKGWGGLGNCEFLFPPLLVLLALCALVYKYLFFLYSLDVCFS